MTTRWFLFVLDMPLPDGPFWFGQHIHSFHRYRAIGNVLEQPGVVELPRPHEPTNANIVGRRAGQNDKNTYRCRHLRGKPALSVATYGELFNRNKNTKDVPSSACNFLGRLCICGATEGGGRGVQASEHTRIVRAAIRAVNLFKNLNRVS